MAIDPCKPHNRAHRQTVIARALDLLPAGADAVAAIEAVYAQALESEHLDGAVWYPSARHIAESIGATLGLTVEAGAGILAALSPQCSWDENVARAFAFVDGAESGAFEDALGKARRIADGADPLSVLGGRKVRSFYRNILGADQYVTVDRHAVAIVCGRSLSDREIKVLERIGAYQSIAAAYRTVARRHGIAPSTLQAITWLAWRRLKGLPAHETDF